MFLEQRSAKLTKQKPLLCIIQSGLLTHAANAMDTGVCPFTTDIIGFRDLIYIALEHYRLGLSDCQLSNRVTAVTADFPLQFQRAQ
jgi:hypothetical protein